jgi:hypothetical protein
MSDRIHEDSEWTRDRIYKVEELSRQSEFENGTRARLSGNGWKTERGHYI